MTIDQAAFFADQQRPTPLPSLEDAIMAEVRRDQWGRPLILQRDGVTRLPYNRASSYGDNIEDKDNIARWQQQQVVRGVAMQPWLLDAVPDDAKGNPWAELDRRDKKALTRIAEQAMDAAGSNLKSALGTDIHAATEYVDLGDSLEGKFDHMPNWRREVLVERANAYYRFKENLGIRWTSVEEFGVQDDVQVAGTSDRIGYVPWRPGAQSVGDVKTSSSMDFAGVGFSVQLSVYAHSDVYDIATEQRTPRENMDYERAWIIHVDRNLHGPVTLAEVDIEWGWRHAMLARQIIVARREGKKRVREMGENEIRIIMAVERADITAVYHELGSRWPSKMLEALASKRWAELAS